MGKDFRINMLQKGRAVGIIAPSSPFKREDLQDSLNFIKDLGLVPVFNEIIFSRDNYLAGSDKDRAADMMSHLNNPEISAIFCARGGYGSMRMLPYLQKRKIALDKPLMGYSDVTALQLYLYKRTGKTTFYGPNVTGHSFKDAQLYKYLTGSSVYDNKIKLQMLFNPGNAKKEIKGKILGGCLSIMASMVGTGFLPSFKNSILFIEDTNEAPYRVDRMITQLIQSGSLKGIKAIVVGSMKNCDCSEHSWKDALADAGKQLNIPVLFGLEAGHESFAVVVPVGAPATLNTGTCEILFQSPFHKKSKGQVNAI
jgi:muramoyltetrapeptide carboxypeptidase